MSRIKSCCALAEEHIKVHSCVYVFLDRMRRGAKQTVRESSAHWFSAFPVSCSVMGPLVLIVAIGTWFWSAVSNCRLMICDEHVGRTWTFWLLNVIVNNMLTTRCRIPVVFGPMSGLPISKPGKRTTPFSDVVWCNLPDCVTTAFRHSRVLRVQRQHAWVKANRGILYPRVTSENLAILAVNRRIHPVHSDAWTSAWCRHVLRSLRKRPLQLWLQRDSLLPSTRLCPDVNFIVRSISLTVQWGVLNYAIHQQRNRKKVHSCMYFWIWNIKVPIQKT